MEKRRLLDISAGFLFIILPILLYAEITIKTPAWQKAKDLTRKGTMCFCLSTTTIIKTAKRC